LTIENSKINLSGESLPHLGFRIRENVEEPSRYGEISVVVIKPETRKLGVGRLLMGFAEQRAKESGCKGTWLVSGFGREEEAHKFYAKLGYKVTGYRFVKPLE
jgi:GNAT superfamily N-acetyltransferase